MATRKSQRIGIAIILAVTIIGTIGSFAVMILGQQNQEQQAAELKNEQAAYQKKVDAYTAQQKTQATELSATYYGTFSQYTSRVGTFDRDSVTALSTEDLTVGTGATIDGTTKFAAYYIGWMPDGKIFDQSIEGTSLKSPLAVDTGLDSASLIDGWKEGMKGMKIGGVRLISIPSDKAYKEKGSTDGSGKEVIPPNTSLRFIVMAIDPPTAIPYPQMSDALLKAYYGSAN